MPSFKQLAEQRQMQPQPQEQETVPGQGKSFTALAKKTKSIQPPAPKSTLEVFSDELNKPGIMNSASKLFGNTAKFVGGAAMNVANALTANSPEVQEMTKSGLDLNDMDQKAIQKARVLNAAGEKEKAKRLLDIVNSHGSNMTLNDLPLIKTGQESVKDISGAGLGTALELGSFSRGLGAAAVSNVVSKIASKVPGAGGVTRTFDKIEDILPRVGPRITGAVKGATRASGEASLYGASQGLQEEDTSLSKVAGSALDYATNPFVLGGGALIGGIAGRQNTNPNRVAKAVDDLEDKYIEISSGKSYKNKIDKARVKTEMKNHAGTTGTDPIRTLSEDGIIPNQNGQYIDSFDQAEQYRQKLKPFNEINKTVLRELDASGPRVRLQDLEEEAVKRVKTADNINAGSAEGLERSIREEFAALKRAYGDDITFETLGDIKSARWGKTKFDAMRPLQGDVNYAIGKTAQQTIEDTARKMGNEEVAQLNRYIGDRLEAAKFLESLNGKVVKGGRLQRYVFQIIGASTASSPLGRILGAYGGDAVANMLISNQVGMGLKKRILMQLSDQSPEAYQRTLQWLANKKINPEMLIGLPAPKPGSPQSQVNVPIHLESEGVASGRANIQQQPFQPGASGIVPDAPAPMPGAQVMRPGQAALPAPSEPPIVLPMRDTSGPVRPPMTPFGNVIRPSYEQIRQSRKAAGIYRPPSDYFGKKNSIDGKIVQ